MSVVRFTVPLVPVSVNHYKKPRRGGKGFYVAPEAKAFKDAVAIFGRGQSVSGESYSVRLAIYLGKHGKGDVDNFAKCVLDGMVEAGVIDSDAAVQRLIIEKFRDAANPRTEIEVRAL